MSKWTYEAAVAVGESYGRPVDARGWFLSTAKASQEAVDKATNLLDDLHRLLDTYGAGLIEDSEQEVVLVELPDGFAVTYSNAHRDMAELLWHGALAGRLTKAT